MFGAIGAENVVIAALAADRRGVVDDDPVEVLGLELASSIGKMVLGFEGEAGMAARVLLAAEQGEAVILTWCADLAADPSPIDCVFPNVEDALPPESGTR